MSLYDDLGVGKDADRATIKRTYRKRAQKEHPDKGGNTEKFYAIQRAYDVLGDDARRAHYDAHGVDGVRDKQNAIAQRLASLLMALIENGDVEHTDLVGAMKEALGKGKSATLGMIRTQEQKIVKYEKALARMKKKSGGENVFAQMIAGQIATFRRGLELGKAELAMVEEMRVMLEDYRYEAAVMAPGQRMEWSAVTSVFGGMR